MRARRPVAGRTAVAHFVLRWAKVQPAGLRVTVEDVNGDPTIVGWLGDSILHATALESDDGAMAGIRFLINPDTLSYLQRRLGPPGSAPSTWAQQRARSRARRTVPGSA